MLQRHPFHVCRPFSATLAYAFPSSCISRSISLLPFNSFPNSCIPYTQSYRCYSKKKRRSTASKLPKDLQAPPASTSATGSKESVLLPSAGAQWAQTQDDLHCESHQKWTALSPYPFRSKRIEPLVKATVPRLAHQLERVLFNPGVHVVKDPRTNVYNFDPYVETIVSPENINLKAFTPFVPSSKDKTLLQLAKKTGKLFMASTSSMTSALARFYFLISGDKPVNISHLSSYFQQESVKYTGASKVPSAIVLNFHDGVYSIDADKMVESESILSVLGKTMEKMLTVPQDVFKQFHKGGSASYDDLNSNPEAYYFTEAEDFFLRAQLDCEDPRLPKHTFDLKTRGTIAIRLDPQNYKENQKYKIKQQFGLFNSFEREYYDLIRSAFMKYSLQVRIGNMDGIFCAYHNTAQIFGFQYIPLEDMDQALFGSSALGTQSYQLSIKLLGVVLKEVIKKFPEQNCRVTFSVEKDSRMSIFAELLEEQLPSEKKEKQIVKFVLQTYSQLNGTPWLEPISLSDNGPSEDWTIHYSLTEETTSQPYQLLLDEYRLVRRRIYLLETSLLKHEPESEVVFEDVEAEVMEGDNALSKKKKRKGKKHSNSLLHFIKENCFD